MHKDRSAECFRLENIVDKMNLLNLVEAVGSPQAEQGSGHNGHFDLQFAMWMRMEIVMMIDVQLDREI